MTKLIGYRKFRSNKNGKDYCVATVIREATAREIGLGAVGQVTDDVFMPENKVDFLRAADIGKEIFLDYELANGRAYLNDVKIGK